MADATYVESQEIKLRADIHIEHADQTANRAGPSFYKRGKTRDLINEIKRLRDGMEELERMWRQEAGPRHDPTRSDLDCADELQKLREGT